MVRLYLCLVNLVVCFMVGRICGCIVVCCLFWIGVVMVLCVMLVWWWWCCLIDIYCLVMWWSWFGVGLLMWKWWCRWFIFRWFGIWLLMEWCGRWYFGIKFGNGFLILLLCEWSVWSWIGLLWMVLWICCFLMVLVCLMGLCGKLFDGMGGVICLCCCCWWCKLVLIRILLIFIYVFLVIGLWCCWLISVGCLWFWLSVGRSLMMCWLMCWLDGDWGIMVFIWLLRGYCIWWCICLYLCVIVCCLRCLGYWMMLCCCWLLKVRSCFLFCFLWCLCYCGWVLVICVLLYLLNCLMYCMILWGLCWRSVMELVGRWWDGFCWLIIDWEDVEMCDDIVY